MSTQTLSVFSGGSQTQAVGNPSTGPRRPGQEPAPIEKLSDSFRTSLAAIKAEEDEARKQSKLAAAKALDFPYEVIAESSPREKLRLSNGVNTYLTVVVDPVYLRLEFSKYAFTPDDAMKLITRLLVEAGYDMDPKSKDCLQIGEYIRPSGF